jgi:hypothetical protein
LLIEAHLDVVSRFVAPHPETGLGSRLLWQQHIELRK